MDAISSLFMRDTPGLPVSGSVTHWSAFSIDAVGVTGNVASLLAADGYGEGIG